MKVRLLAIIMLLVMLTFASCAYDSRIDDTDVSGDAQIESSEACSHKRWSKATCVELSKCKECGKTRGEFAEHDFPIEGVTCQEKLICRVCGAEGDFGYHSYKGGDCITPSVCEYCGAEGDLKSHKYGGEPTCTEGCVCSVCGDTVDPLGHSMTRATCTKPSTCRRCSYTEGEALGHDGLGKCVRCNKWIDVSGSGHGDGVVEKINLGDSGIYVLHMTHSGRRNFIVHSFDATGDEEYLINEIGKYDGTVLFVGTSPMMINVEADGDWTFEVTSLGTTSDTSFSGSGDFVTKRFSCASGTNVWHFKHDGSHNFIVWVYTAKGYDLIVNEIGAYDADQIVKIPSGAAFFEITADGNWEIYLD